jgi:hypothetical protein
VQAALAYDQRAVDVLGPDAKTNFTAEVREKLVALSDAGGDLGVMDQQEVLERLANGDASAVDQAAAGELVGHEHFYLAPGAPQLAPPHLQAPMLLPLGLTVGGCGVCVEGGGGWGWGRGLAAGRCAGPGAQLLVAAAAPDAPLPSAPAADGCCLPPLRA